MKQTRRTFATYVIGAALPISANAQTAAPKISSIGGYGDGYGVVDAKWTGQPMAKPRSNAYLGFYVVAPPNNAARNLTHGDTYSWTITGTNFGANAGSVWVLDPYAADIGVTVKIVSWTNTSIKVVVNAPHTFTSKANAVLWVSKLKTRPLPASNASWASRSTPVVGLIQSRGYGQCTWFVAKTRLDAGLSIPFPRAYTNTATLSGIGGTSNYVPRQWDALNYGGLHVAIISSAVTTTTNSDQSITYSFTVREMNATTNEAESSSVRYYKVSKANTSGARTVVQMIGSNAGSNYVATGYFR